MIGGERILRDNLTMSFQFIEEIMTKYDEYTISLLADSKKEDKTQDMFTLRIIDKWKNDTIKPQIFTVYSISDKDYTVNFEIEHGIADELSYTVGLYIFGGGDNTTFFGQFDKNDQLYSKIRYSF